MKPICQIFVISICCIALTSCDPTYHADFIVENKTEQSLKIVVDYFGDLSDTNVITTSTKLLFFTDFGIGFTTSDFLDNLEVLPVGLAIYDYSGRRYKMDETDLTFWHKIYPDKKSNSIGQVELKVVDADFE